LLFNFALEYTTRKHQVIQDGLKLNVTHQLLAYAEDDNLLGGNLHAVKEKAEALIVTGKEIGLEVNADKTKFMVTPRNRNAVRSHRMKINNAFGRVEELKYLGTAVSAQNSINPLNTKLNPICPLLALFGTHHILHVSR